MASIANALYSWRHVYRFTQEKTAARLGVSLRSLGRWERDECLPSPAHAAAIRELVSGPPWWTSNK